MTEGIKAYLLTVNYLLRQSLIGHAGINTVCSGGNALVIFVLTKIIIKVFRVFHYTGFF